VLVTRGVFAGACDFEGEYYSVNLPPIGPRLATPPLICAALGGTWTFRHVGPLVDVIEIATMGPAFRNGTTDWAHYLATRANELQAMIAAAKEANRAARVGLSIFTGCGTGPMVEMASQMYSGTIFEGLAGEPARVADRVRELGELGVDRVTLLPLTEETHELLADHLLSPHD